MHVAASVTAFDNYVTSHVLLHAASLSGDDDSRGVHHFIVSRGGDNVVYTLSTGALSSTLIQKLACTIRVLVPIVNNDAGFVPVLALGLFVSMCTVQMRYFSSMWAWFADRARAYPTCELTQNSPVYASDTFRL